ncbi:Neutral ceramidase [Blattella germanica]|nr:Neutral ceramidase [Blattella germanica]
MATGWLATLIVVVFSCCAVEASYKIGIGIADVTGPAAEVGFMGYGQMGQKGKGLHLRQFSRAFIFDDGNNRLVFVSVDAAMVGNGLRREVLARLKPFYGDLYTEKNVMISGTHTHSTPGGFMQDLLFDISVLGFVRQTFVALMAGIVISIRRAHETMTRGKVYLSVGTLAGASINRSPTAYLANPTSERAKYGANVDQEMVQLRLVREDGRPMGAINWFAVHATSMNNSNTLVSSDNVGYAAILFEQKMNPGQIIGKRVQSFQGPFIAAFASSNLGDVSPNVKGPRCEFSGRPCDVETSTCSGKEEMCISSGPGRNMFDSTQIIGRMIFEKAVAQVRQEILNVLIRRLCNVQGVEVQATLDCGEKDEVLMMDFPFEWQPRIVSTQLALMGSLAIACVPGEFTTMSGRRVRETVSSTVQRYEGASTIFGPHTLTIYLNQYRKLASALLKNSQLDPGPTPPDLTDDLVTFVTPVVFDTPKWDHKFGDCLQQPPEVVHTGDTVSVKFVLLGSGVSHFGLERSHHHVDSRQ